MYAEVIYETGSHSVVEASNVEELKAGLKEQHRRATSGEAGGPTGHPAERIKRVLLYEDHPGNDVGTEKVSAEAVSKLIDGMTKDGKLDGNQLVTALRDEMSPVYPVNQGKHQSQYKTAEVEELDLSFLGDAA